MGSLARTVQETLRARAKIMLDPALRRSWAQEQVIGDELARLRALPRYAATTSTLLDPPMQVVDGPSFAAQYDEIFCRRLYEFPFAGAAPVIVDAGANVGVATRFFLSLWPEATIVALEPDPGIFAALTANVGGHPGVTLRRAALSDKRGTAIFISEGSDGGHIERGGGAAAAEAVADAAAEGTRGTSVEVETLPLSELLTGMAPVDLLKIDVEGAETDILREAAGELHRCAYVMVEYHSMTGAAQTLDEVLGILRGSGFRVHLHNDMPVGRPFTDPSRSPMDLQLNVFAWREA